MAVRVRVRIEPLVGSAPPGTRVETVAIVNSGYEADDDEFSLPTNLAARLGLWPQLPPQARSVTVHGYTGTGTIHVVPAGIRVQVLEPDRQSAPVTCVAAIAPAEYEALISDALAGSLELDLVNPRTGLWVFRGEPAVPGRRSQPPEHW